MKFLSSIILLSLSFNIFASPIPDFPFVTVTGESTRKVTPDTAVINLHIFVFEKDSVRGNKVLTSSLQQVLEILANNGVTSKSITSNEIRKETKRAREKNGYNQLEVLGYEFSQSVEIKLDSLDNYSAISSQLTKTDNIVNINSQFDVSNRSDIEIELITAAGKEAKLKAKQMALGLGVKIDSVFAINDSGSFKSFFATFGLDSFGRSTGLSLKKPSAPNSSQLFIPEYIEISKSINVLYKLED